MNLLATITEERRSAFEFAGLPDGWLRLLGVLALAGICYAVVWLYRREGRAGASATVRISLGVIRCTVLLLLAIIWLQPVIATYTKRTIRASVAVLIDDSASMSITDPSASGDVAAATTGDSDSAAGSNARIAKVRDLLTARENDWLKRLSEKNDLSVYTFGEHVRRVRLPWDPATTQPAEPADSQPVTQPSSGPARPAPVALADALDARQSLTDLGLAFSRLLDDAGESPIAAVIVISDGIVNQGLSEDDAAAYARTFKAPVHTVGVGGPVEPPNVRVTDFSAPAAIAKGDPLELRIEVGAVGIEQTPLTVELLSRPVASGRDPTSAPAEEKLVGQREVVLGGEQPPTELRFKVNADVAGEFLYRARVASVPNEAVEFDNVRAASVAVLDEKLRVLLIAGRPTYDYRAVTALLGRDKTIDLSCWLQSADAQAVRDGSVQITELPRKPEDLFAYDAIIMMDPDPREFDAAWALNVRRLVDELGGGVCLEAGPLYASRFLRDDRLTDLVSLLPVQPDPDADVRLTERGSFSTQMQPMRVPDESRGHPALNLSPDLNVNRAIWDALPGVWWFLPVLREKPVATVLLRAAAAASLSDRGPGKATIGGASSGAVLMAAQPFGAGRTVYMGFDSTWRWRGSAERVFNRFWVQMVRYLAQARRQGVSRRGTISLDRESLNVGEYVKIEARVLDASFAPWNEADVNAVVELSDGQTRDVKLGAIPGRDGWFAGRVAPEQDGPAIIRINLPESEPAVSTAPSSIKPDPSPFANRPAAAPPRNTGPESLVKHFTVNRPDLEMRTLRLRSDTLTHLAEATRGRYVPIEAARDLPSLIENASLIRPIEGPKHDLWDRSWVLILISGLLGIEWYVRRRNHLL